MRQISGHEGSTLNSDISITADDRDDNGGAHSYQIQFPEAHDSEELGGIIDIKFQQGPLQETGYNGITDEALIAIVIDRLEGFNTGPFRNRYNSLAITKLEEGLMWLNKRTTDRQNRGVEGTHKI